MGMATESGFGFATHGEGKGDGWKTGKLVRGLPVCHPDVLLPASAPSSPTKNRLSVLKAVSSPLTACTADSMYTASCLFDDWSELPFVLLLNAINSF